MLCRPHAVPTLLSHLASGYASDALVTAVERLLLPPVPGVDTGGLLPRRLERVTAAGAGGGGEGAAGGGGVDGGVGESVELPVPRVLKRKDVRAVMEMVSVLRVWGK